MSDVLSRDVIEDICYRTFDLLNGVVNPSVIANGIYLNLDINTSSMFYIYNDGTRDVHINPKEIQYILGDKTIEEQNAMVVHIICHELIHCQQCIKDYTEYIEIEANALAMDFMNNYLQWLSNRLVLPLDIRAMKKRMDDDLHLIRFRQRIQRAHTRYIYGPNGPIRV